MRLALRYDMRAPAFGAPAADLYAASVEQCAWADRIGFETVYLAEHHGADDGYCPAPIVQASAILARTERMRVHFSALIAVLHHPIRLAEDLAVLDVLSGGRIEMTLGIGYRPHEYAMFDIPKARRVPILEETITVLEQAWTGEPFEFRGMTVVVRPTPVQRPRPPIYIGGSSAASAVRAARIGDNYLPATSDLLEVYQQERRRLGREIRRRRHNGDRSSCSSPTIRNATGRSSARMSSTRRTRTPSGRRSEESARPPTRRSRPSRSCRGSRSSRSSPPINASSSRSPSAPKPSCGCSR